MTEQIKLCKDCKWYKKDWVSHILGDGDKLDMCLNPLLNENLITGKSKGRFCDMMRLPYGKCGKEGKYWEARK